MGVIQGKPSDLSPPPALMHTLLPILMAITVCLQWK